MNSSKSTDTAARTWPVATVVWVAAFLLSLATLVFHNDHFGRISPARQIALYGELPFRDFLDPGYYLTELSSAALQRLLGDNLLGEALLTTASVATGTALVFIMALRLAPSFAIALTAAALSLLLLPRAYDYDKVLFYPLGLLLCWRYVARPGRASVWILSAGLLIAAMFRYDTGVYIGASALVTLAVVHASDWRRFLRRAALLVAAVAGLSVPALLFLQLHGGIVGAVDQMVTYGLRETARTRVATGPRFSILDEPIDRTSPSPAEPALARARRVVPSSLRWLPGSFHTRNADAFLYHVFRLLPLAAILALVVAFWARRGSPLAPGEPARVAGLVTMSMLLNVFILRDPVGARIGGMAGPAAALSAWLLHRAWHAGNGGFARVMLRSAAVLFVALAAWSVSESADWKTRLRPEAMTPAHLGAVLEQLAASPLRLESLPNVRLRGLVQYLRECTRPQDRMFATWFVPELYFLAQRGFAGDVVALFGGHWSEPRFENRIVRSIASQAVPIVIHRTSDDSFAETYPMLARLLGEQYRVAGASTFGDPEIDEGGYTVLVRRDRMPGRLHGVTSMPCFW